MCGRAVEARHDVEHVVVLRIPEGVVSVFFDLFEPFEGEAPEKALGVGAGVVRSAGDARPTVAVAEELAGESRGPALAGRTGEGGDDLGPDLLEVFGGAEGQTETGVDERGALGRDAGEVHLLELRFDGQEAERRVGLVRGFGAEAREAFCGAVHGGDAPAAAEGDDGVASGAGAEVDHESAAGSAFGVEAVEGEEEGVASGVALDGVEIGGPVAVEAVAGVSEGAGRVRRWGACTILPLSGPLRQGWPSVFDSLHDFVNTLDRAGELQRISARVSPVLEIAAIADRASKSPCPRLPSQSARRNDPRFHHLGGRALLFENVDGSDIPVLINSMGSYRRMEIALGCHEPHPDEPLPPPRAPGGGFDAWGKRIAALVEPRPPSSLGDALAKAREFLPLLRTPPRNVFTGPCQEVVYTGDRVDLSRLPVIKCWPLDGDLGAVGWPAGINEGVAGLVLHADPHFQGRYITLAGIHTIHADDAGNPKPSSRNIGMYRVQLLGRNRVAMHWHMHHDGARHWRSWKKRGERMPVAIVLGGESALPYAATAPLPPGLSEILLAGFLHGRGIPMCPCKTVPLRVPANAEIVIEGWVSHEAGPIGFDPRKDVLGPGAVVEGPFGDHTGFYSLPDRYPIVEVTAVTMRRNAIYPTTIVGLPPQEDYYMGKATERVFLPLLRTLVPDILDYDLPMFGAFHNCAFLKIRKEYPLHARRVMHAIWGAGQMSWTKHIVVVDEDVNVHDHAEVMRAVGERCHPGRDIETVKGPLDILDHAAPFLGAGTKMGFDATRRMADERMPGADAAASEAPGWHDWPPSAPDASDRQAAVDAARAVRGVIDADLPEALGGRWLFVSVADEPGVVDRLAAMSSPAPYTVVVSRGVDPRSFDEALFHWCASSDPGRDRTLAASGRAVIFDATGKQPGDGRWGLPVRPFPPILKFDEETLSLVERRWGEYGV